jgi:hypothetical protein
MALLQHLSAFIGYATAAMKAAVISAGSSSRISPDVLYNI